MDFPQIVYILGLLGTFVFGISGALVGVRKRMDLAGVLSLSVITGLFGNTIGSVIMGDFPVPFLKDSTFVLLAILAALIIFFSKEYIYRYTKLIKMFDGIGMGIFFSTGMTLSLQHHYSFLVSMLVGLVMAVSGGVVREVLSSEIPLILRKEPYAIICMSGGIGYFILYLFPIPRELIMLSTAVLICLVRLYVIQKNIFLPR